MLLFLLLVAGCQFGVRIPFLLTARSESVILAWHPAVLDIPNSSVAEAKSYRVYYTFIGSTNWLLLAEVQATDNPRYTIHFKDLQGEGDYAFAVQAVMMDGRASPLHASTDFTASPPSGWYLFWMRPN